MDFSRKGKQRRGDANITGNVAIEGIKRVKRLGPRKDSVDSRSAMLWTLGKKKIRHERMGGGEVGEEDS